MDPVCTQYLMTYEVQQRISYGEKAIVFSKTPKSHPLDAMQLLHTFPSLLSARKVLKKLGKKTCRLRGNTDELFVSKGWRPTTLILNSGVLGKKIERVLPTLCSVRASYPVLSMYILSYNQSFVLFLVTQSRDTPQFYFVQHSISSISEIGMILLPF